MDETNLQSAGIQGVDRTKRHNEGKTWSVSEELTLYQSFTETADVRDLGHRHGRTHGAIGSRLKSLGLLDDMGSVVKPKPKFQPSKSSLTRVARADRASDPAHSIDFSNQLFLTMLRRLSTERRLIAMQVLRGLLALGQS